MICVTVNRSSTNEIESFVMKGHADYAEYGEDIVCAGASAVSFGTVNAIIALTNITPYIEQGGDGGFLRCELPKNLSRDIHEKVQLLLEGMVISLQSIEREYGKYIKIIAK